MPKFFSLTLTCFLVCVALSRSIRCEENADDKIRKALARKVTFEFQDTPLVDAIDFIRHLTNVAIILDPKIIADGKEKSLISLRVADMNLDVALDWILKLADLQYKIKSQAIYIYPPDKDAENAIPKGVTEAGVLRLRFASGDVIEADMALIKQFPHIMDDILALGYDPAKDDILVLSQTDVPPHVMMADFIVSAKTIAPLALFNFDEKLKLLSVRSPEPGDLRRVNAFARALRRAPVAPPAHAAVKVDATAVKPPRPPDESKVKQTPAVEPQF